MRTFMLFRYMTVLAHHISIIPCIKRYGLLICKVQELEDDFSLSSGNSQLQRALDQRLRELRWGGARHCLEVGLMDKRLLSKCLAFYTTVARFLLIAMQAANQAASNNNNIEVENQLKQ